MAIGFVYLLANRCMPDLYKIGCTERSPSKRAAELSGVTGVPEHFDVVCYWEGENFQEYERELHSIFELCRENSSREFFRTIVLREMVDAIEGENEKDKYSFCITKIGQWYLKQDDERGPR